MAKRKIKIKKNKLGAVLLMSFFGLLFFLLILRYSFIMLTGHSSGEDLIVRANEKYLAHLDQDAERGKIYDRNNKVLAEDVDRFRLAAVLDKRASKDSKKPRHVVDKKKTAKVLAKVIDMPEKEIEKRLNTKKAFQVEFGRAGQNLTYHDKEIIEKANLPGITLYPEVQRFYPNGNFASHLVGMAQKDPDTGELKGALGVEEIFDSYLSGKKGHSSFTKDIWGYIIPNSKNEVAPKRGDDVHLTIDSNIQVFVEEALDDMVKHYAPKDVFAVVMDAKTGEILAYSQRPTFNPDTGEDFGKKWANDLYQNTYEPGSTFKSFGLAAAIQEGKFKPNDKYESGYRDIEGSRIYDWNKKGWGKINMSLGFTYSSNTLMMTLQDLVGADKMQSWYEKFGFGKSTGSLFDGEQKGNIAWENKLMQKTSAFGQSTTVTPAQMLQAQSAFFNKGEMLRPYFIQSIMNPVSNQTFFEGKREVAGKPITPETAKKVDKQLDEVVNSEDSHAKNYRIDGYRIGGKTGTAQVANPDNGGYVKGPNPYFVSFMGHAPSNNPRVVVYAGMSLAQKNDQEAYEMGVSKAFNPIMKHTLQYLNVDNNEVNDKSTINSVPKVKNSTVQRAEDEIKGKKLNPVVIGNGEKVVNQSPSSSTKLLPNSHVLLMTDGDMTMPDMTGWTRDDIVAFESLTGIEVKVKGSGFVKTQSQSPQSAIDKKSKIEVTLESENTE
ncbi:penicillin-binding protein [Staphylococcus schleiferi]|uniref:penicillin-binding protein n=1 Tax=Staphylococcus schleiferi TaxID=1295 RepID=UPI0018877A20|nr:penicillin-binding protein [Staphylococcus schleiferi]MBF1992683.1 penicillin-binding protein [Staphylococcus schleiferi]MBF2102558.1 penicillin-binding protein [Staphylococcus schleiferi]MBF2104648.1 penicillin-binding protein [Staphylococcus schleiferi]MBF2113244.1 penicillin-binding protein [Staphylococcus schleiferi]MBF2117400.1 penicillin-binding protein [Staphylococcus schleiferi]